MTATSCTWSAPPTLQLSTMAMTTASTGRLSVASVCRAELPEATSTISSGPAPTASAATSGAPVVLPVLVHRAHEEELEPVEARLLARGDNGADHLRQQHTRLLRAGAVGPAPDRLLLRRLGLGRPAERHDLVHVEVRARDDVHGDDLADAAGRDLRRVARRLHRRHVAADDDRHVAAAGLLVGDQFDRAALTAASAASTTAGNDRVSIMPSASVMVHSCNRCLCQSVMLSVGVCNVLSIDDPCQSTYDFPFRPATSAIACSAARWPTSMSRSSPPR